MLATTTLNPIIVALRNEKGSYNSVFEADGYDRIVALRNEKGSYNLGLYRVIAPRIVALRNEKGSYNGIRRLVQ